MRNRLTRNLMFACGIIIGAAAAFALSGCNMMQGFGQDIANIAEATSRIEE